MVLAYEYLEGTIVFKSASNFLSTIGQFVLWSVTNPYRLASLWIN